MSEAPVIWVSSPARGARSPLDYHAHLLLPEGDHPVDARGRCRKSRSDKRANVL